MNAAIRFKLSVMMFLEFFVWGAWFVTLGTFLGNNLHANNLQIGSAFSTQSFGAIIAPFIIGLIADRYFNAEKILGILHLSGVVLMYQMYCSSDFTAFYPYVFIYMIVYMPTLALVNSVAFNQMKNPEKEFGFIRAFGTLGWIVAGLLISYAFHWDSEASLKEGLLKNTFLMTSIASLVLGLFSFLLPKTPPKINKEEKVKLSSVLGLDALKLLKDKNYIIFFSFGIDMRSSCILLPICQSVLGGNRLEQCHRKNDFRANVRVAFHVTFACIFFQIRIKKNIGFGNALLGVALFIICTRQCE